MNLLARTGSLSDRLAEDLVIRIKNREFSVGERLPSSNTLAQGYGVSLSVVREALSRLKQEGLLQSQQGAGYFLAATSAQRTFKLDAEKVRDPKTLGHVFELRQALEATAARLAAQHRSDEHLAVLAKSLHEIDAAISSESGVQTFDHDFHRTIIIAAGNPILLEFWEFLDEKIRDSVRHGRKHATDRVLLRKEAQVEHRAILSAIEAQDGDGAEVAARRHIKAAARRLGLGFSAES